MCVSVEEVHRMAAEAVEWQKLGLRNLPLSAGQLNTQKSVVVFIVIKLMFITVLQPELELEDYTIVTSVVLENTENSCDRCREMLTCSK